MVHLVSTFFWCYCNTRAYRLLKQVRHAHLTSEINHILIREQKITRNYNERKQKHNFIQMTTHVIKHNAYSSTENIGLIYRYKIHGMWCTL